jgi:hypothetical protein
MIRWIQMDNIVLNWISNSISADLHQVVRERGCTTRHLWLAIENQFLGNREQRTLHLDTAFRNFVQGDLSVSEYCRKFKTMADGLADLGSHIEDRILVLNILQGLNQCFEHVGSIIRHYSPFPNFPKVRDDLLLEEIHMNSTGPSAAPTALYTPTVRPRQPGHHPPCRLAHPAVATAATGTRTTIRTATTVMAVATTVGTATAVAAVIALMARPPPPLPLTIESARHGQLTATCGRGT